MTTKAPLPDLLCSLTGKPWAVASEIIESTKRLQENPTEIMQLLLREVGLSTADDLEKFLRPSFLHLPQPMLMKDMDLLIERLLKAQENKEKIVIYGDYDVDGVCASALLLAFFQQINIPADNYIPDRRSEGYGLNCQAIETLAQQYDLLITVDCGITAHEPLALAHEKKLDVLVIDHHQVQESIPLCYAAVNPHRADCPYPYKDLCAAGLALMVAIAFRATLRQQGFFKQQSEPDIREFLDIAALATVADMVPLNGINRLLVKAGLEKIRHSPRLGIKALMDVSQCQAEQLQASDIAFRLAPRLNAKGRMDHASMGVALLLCQEEKQAVHYASLLDETNQQRRQEEQHTLRQAFKQVETEQLEQDAGFVVGHEDWHPGIIGLVASRLMQQYNRPAIVIGQGGKGSARSVPSLHLLHALDHCQAHLQGYGGHPAAAGLQMSLQQLPELRKSFKGFCQRQLGTPPFRSLMSPKLELAEEAIDPSWFALLQQLEPHGQRHPQPLFFSRHLHVHSKRLVGENHLKLLLGQKKISAIAFQMASLLPLLQSHIDVLYYLERNHYQGKTTLQMRLIDIRNATTHDDVAVIASSLLPSPNQQAAASFAQG